MANPHSGHRARMKERFWTDGGKTLCDHELLELLLYYAIPRRDTNEIAHRLIERFGSLYAVFEATPQVLIQVEGISAHSATLIQLMLECCRRYYDGRVAVGDNADGDIVAQIAQSAIARCIGLTNESLFVACLDNRLRLARFEEIGSGTPDNVQVICRKVAELAIRYNSASVVLAHNHPNGFAIPSRADVDATLRLRETLGGISINLLDHIIVAGDDYVSLAQTGVFQRERSCARTAFCVGEDDDSCFAREK